MYEHLLTASSTSLSVRDINQVNSFLSGLGLIHISFTGKDYEKVRTEQEN